MLSSSQSKLGLRMVVTISLAGSSVGVALSLVFGWWPEYVLLLLAGLVGLGIVGVLFSPPVNRVRLDFFAPYILFPFAWIAAVGLSSLRLTVFQEPWSISMWLCVGLALLAYIMGVLTVLTLGKQWRVEKNLKPRFIYRWHNRRLQEVSSLVMLISIACLVYEYRKAGVIPILSSQIELARFDAIAGGYVDTLAVSARIVVMILGIQVLSQREIRLKRNLSNIALILTALVLMASTGRRGTVVFPLVVVVVGYHYLKRRFSLKELALMGSAGFLLIALFSHYRYVRTFGSAPLESAWRPGRFVWMTLGYMTVSDNFRTLNLLIETIPARVPFQMGRFTTYGIYSILPGHQENLGDFQNRIWGWERYSGSVSTYLGPFYVDFGLVGVIVGSFLIGVLAMFLYNKMLSCPSPYTILLYSYMAYCLMFMTFSNPFTWTLTYWDIMAFAVINAYAKRRIKSAPDATSGCRYGGNAIG